MESIPLHRAAVVRPFVQYLAAIGTPVERRLQQVGLPCEAFEDVNNYVPSHRFWAFLVNMVRYEGIEDLGFRVGHTYGADSADPQLSRLLCQSPTLYHGLVTTSALVNKTVAGCHMGLWQPAGSAYTYFYHRPSCDRGDPSIGQIGGFSLSAMLAMVRVFAGPQWSPPEIGLITPHPPSRYLREQLPDVRIRPLQQYSYVAVDNALLSLPPCPHAAATPAFASPPYEPMPHDFVGSLKQVLLAYIQERDLSLALAAELCHMSTRSLQRRLTEMGTCYSEVLEQARFHAASQILHDPAMQVTEVAYRLGYSDPTHFSRAFRRIAGVTPRVYRQQYAS